MDVRERIDSELEKLTHIERDMIWMTYGYKRPDGYTGILPASTATAAEFLGIKYLGRALSRRRVQQMNKAVHDRWKAGWRVNSV